MSLFCRLFFVFLGVSLPLFANPLVLVSIAPYETVVQEVGGEEIDVQTVVPAGASAHTYEPKPRMMMEQAKADAWFIIGEPFEQRAAPSMQSHHPALKIVDLRTSIDLLYGSACPHCKKNGREAADLHFWLSPRRVKKQVPLIVQTLSDLYPEHADTFQTNGDKLQEKLSQLDDELTEITNEKSQDWILVSHPAYAYFASDYSFEQLPIEVEGKDPSPKQLAKLLKSAHDKKIQTIFVQEQHSTRGAQRIAQELKAKIVVLDPYDPNYFDNLRFIAQQFSNQ